MSSGWMMRRSLIYVLAGPLLVWGWLQAGELRKPVGRLVLTLSATVAPEGGMGRTTGEGRLTLLDGATHAFSVSGLNLQGRGGSSIDLEARGEVYHLQRLEDFAGTYRRVIGAIAGNAGMGAAIGAGAGLAGGYLYGKHEESKQAAYQQGVAEGTGQSQPSSGSR